MGTSAVKILRTADKTKTTRRGQLDAHRLVALGGLVLVRRHRTCRRPSVIEGARGSTVVGDEGEEGLGSSKYKIFITTHFLEETLN